MRNKTILTAFVVLTLVGCTRTEKEPSNHAERLYNLTSLASVNSMSDTFVEQLQLTKPEGEKLSQDEEDIYALYRETSLKLITNNIDKEAFKDAYLQYYSSTYTDAELEFLVEFYESETAQKMINQKPEVGEILLQIGKEQMADVFPKLKELLENRRHELRGIPR